MINREKEAVVKRVEDSIMYDAVTHNVSVAYPWTNDVHKLTDNLGQAISFQASVEHKLLKDQTMKDAYNAELRKFIERGAIVRLTQEEMDEYKGPVSYVSHHAVFKPGSVTTPHRIVTNKSLRNRSAGILLNQCMEEGPNALSLLLEVVIGFRMQEVALVYEMTKAYQSIATREFEKHVRRIVWRWYDPSGLQSSYGWGPGSRTRLEAC